jgi:hypothetical protein
MPNTSRIPVERVPADELSDSQIERLMEIGSAEADLIDEMESAVRAGDRDLVWQLAATLVRHQDEARKVGNK